MFIRGIMRKNEINVKAHDIFFSSWVQSLSCAWLFATPWTAARQASLSINSWSSLRLMSIESVMPSNHLILCCPLLLLTSIFPSISVFSNESALCITWPKYWNFSFNASPSNEYPGLIFRMDWLDLLAVQGTLKRFLQHHSSKASLQMGEKKEVCHCFHFPPSIIVPESLLKNWKVLLSPVSPFCSGRRSLLSSSLSM